MVPGLGTVTITDRPEATSASRASSGGPAAPAAAWPWPCTTTTTRSATPPAPPCSRAGPEVPALPVHQEHDPQGLRRAVQGHLRGDLRVRVQGGIRGGRDHLRAPADRRHGRAGAQVGGRHRLGHQELRRRRAVRRGGPGLRLARPDDQRADDAGRPHRRGRSRPRHRDPALPPAPAGQAHLDQPGRVDLRLGRGAWPTAASSTARPRSPGSPAPWRTSACRPSRAAR